MDRKFLITDLIVIIILDYFKKTMHNLFTIRANIRGCSVKEDFWNF